MHKQSFRIAALGLICLIAIPTVASGNVFKWIRVGRLHNKMVDSGDQGESAGEGTFLYYYYNLDREAFDHAGYQMGAKDADGNIIISGAGHGNSNELELTMPIEDKEGITIHKYLRYQPPKITVNGNPLDAPYPLSVESDHVDPDKIPGTADAMVESWFKTNLGLEVHQRMLGWSQHNHDDYLIYEWTFTNTGDIDLDDDVELPDQTVKDMYFFRAINWVTGYSRNWNSAYGMTPGDSLRIHFAYPQRSMGKEKDDLGDPRSSGWLRRPVYFGEAILHVDTKPGHDGTRDHTDDPSQPRSSGYHTAENNFWKMNATLTSLDDHARLYQVMSEGLKDVFTMPEIPAGDVYPGTHHIVPMDQRGIKFVREFPWWNWRAVSVYTCGPFTFEPGDSLTIAFAMVAGSIDLDKGWEVGTAWNDGTANDLWGGPTNPWKLEQPHIDFPELSEDDNDKAKDSWVFSGRDSLFQNAWAAQWCYRNNYNVPAAPPAPNLEVTGLPGKINLKWDYDGITHSKTIDGYRVYRSLGSPDTGFVKIYTAGPNVHEWDDDDPVTGPERGQDYYYFVTAYDDGDNPEGVFDTKQVLESSWHQNRTSVPASLTRESETDLSEVVVVPNPFNISAWELQYAGAPDKIMFLNLPPVCTIYIYSESGDLVRTLEHTDGSGDEPWGVIAEEQSTSDYGQIIVSGLYIAYIETPGGDSRYVKFVIVR